MTAPPTCPRPEWCSGLGRCYARWLGRAVCSDAPAGPGAADVFPIVPPGQIDAEVAEDWHRLTHPERPAPG